MQAELEVWPNIQPTVGGILASSACFPDRRLSDGGAERHR